MRGQKYNNDIKEKALAMLAVNNSQTYVAKVLGVPRTTIIDWQKEADRLAVENGKDTIVKLRQSNRERFVNQSWDIIHKSQALIAKKLNSELEAEEAIDKLVIKLANTQQAEISQEELADLANKLKASRQARLNELSSVLSTMYDKQALANKEPTEIVEGSVQLVKFEDM